MQLLVELTRPSIYGRRGEKISIMITSHNLESALAILSAFHIAESNLDKLDNIQKLGNLESALAILCAFNIAVIGTEALQGVPHDAKFQASKFNRRKLSLGKCLFPCSLFMYLSLTFPGIERKV